jgi:predicted RNA binding protein YcfA (HicA-like mRNA interferase family)
MSQIEKLLEKYKIRPESLAYRDLCKVLTMLRCEEVSTKGSHVKWKHPQLHTDIIIPIHNNECKPFYKKQSRKILDSIIQSL